MTVLESYVHWPESPRTAVKVRGWLGLSLGGTSKGQQTNIFRKKNGRALGKEAGSLGSSPDPPLSPCRWGFGSGLPTIQTGLHGGVRRRQGDVCAASRELPVLSGPVPRSLRGAALLPPRHFWGLILWQMYSNILHVLTHLTLPTLLHIRDCLLQVRRREVQ